MKLLFLTFIIFLLFACNTQKKLQKNYIGKPISFMIAEFGKAKTTFNKTNGREYIFEKKEDLKSTEITQHKLTLDPMVTPKAVKISRYYVSSIDGIITEIKFEEHYER